MAWNALHWNSKFQTKLLKRSGRMKKKPSPIERKVKTYLADMGLQFQNQIVIGAYICDFVDMDGKMIIECDGAKWHSTEKQRVYDDNRDDYLKRMGYSVLHLFGWQCWNESVAVPMIKEFIEACKTAKRVV